VEWESRSRKILISPRNPVLVVAAIAHLGKLVSSGSRNRCCHAGFLTRNVSLFIEVVWESRRRRISMRHRNPLVAGEAIVRLGKLISWEHGLSYLLLFLQEPYHYPSKWLGKTEVAEF
jgi:hypothetical protein